MVDVLVREAVPSRQRSSQSLFGSLKPRSSVAEVFAHDGSVAAIRADKALRRTQTGRLNGLAAVLTPALITKQEVKAFEAAGDGVRAP